MSYVIPATTWINLECILPSERSQAQDCISEILENSRKVTIILVRSSSVAAGGHQWEEGTECKRV